jgi:hypothetical protein
VPSAPQGDLAGGGVLAGTAALSFTATDRGGGLYRAYAVVDGRRQPPVGIGDSRCHALLAGGSDYEFAYRRPCPLTGGAVVALDTTTLSEGRHTIAVEVEDAAGNAVTVYGPSTRTVDNVPPASPRPSPRPPAVHRPPSLAPSYVLTASFADHARAATVSYGTRARFRGRLRLAPGPDRAYLAAPPTAPFVAGVRLAVSARIGLAGASWRALTGVATRADGRFTLFTPVGPSRRVRIVAPGGAAAELVLRVRAPVTARVRDGVVRGRVRGGHIPRGGALVELQARTGRRWVTRRVVRTFAGGRYAGRAGARGLVRTRVPRQPGLPFAAGVSPRRRAGRTAAGTSR